ncbi:MAG: aminotransferase class V-fold PLP-dependent enzyme [Congregibacter sp.]
MHTSRRQFVGLLSAGAVLGAAGGTSSVAASDTSIRHAFAFDDAHIPMNAANLCPSPRRVAEAVTRYTSMIDADCSFQNRARFSDLLERSRTAVAKQLQVSVDEIALVRNTSEANTIVNAGLDLGPGDEVLLWDQNHPSNSVSWDVRAARSGMQVVRVGVPGNPSDEDELLAPFLRAITPRARVLSVTHISNISGLKLPITALGQLCRERGIHFHVDGAQTWGAVDIDLHAIGCDSFSASAHKWFMGPKEVGLLYVREDALKRIWPSVVSYGWGDDELSDLVGARRFESLGQRDDAALAALADTASIHAELSPAQIERHVQILATRLKEGLLEAGLPLVTPLSPTFSGGVCIAKVGSEMGAEMWNRLYTEHGIIGAATGGLRLCPHIYNTAEHVDRAVAGVRTLRDKLG